MRKATLVLALALCLGVLLSVTAAAQDQNPPSQQQTLVANRAFVIDFGTYQERILQQFRTNEQIMKNKEEERKRKNLPKLSSGLPTEDPNYMPKPEDWDLNKWEVELNSSASSVMNNVMSYVKPVKSGFWARNKNTYYDALNIDGYNTHKGSTTDTVLGVRIHFPTHRQNCWAKIHPPFEIYAYDDDGKVANQYNGIIDNVGQIKNMSVWVKGRNYNNALAVRLKDREGVEKEYFFGSLNFHNWRELTWANPNYIEDPKDRVLVRLPLYPRSRPYVKFICFIVYRQMDDVGGDFVLYIRDLKISFDKAVPDDDKTDIDDEGQWGILARERMQQKERELLKLAEKKVLLEREKNKFQQTKASGNTGQ